MDAAGRIHLEDGRTLPANYRSFAHGYAVTAHRSQGKTVDSVIISGDGMQKELFYVAASRGRQSVTVITSDKERLCNRPWPVHGTNVGVRASARQRHVLASQSSARDGDGARNGSESRGAAQVRPQNRSFSKKSFDSATKGAHT